jgi:hypothetical protein
MAYLYINSQGKEVRSHSYSAGSLFHECAQKYKLARLDGWKERENRASQQFGIALEESIRVYHQLDLAEALDNFRRLWTAQRDAELKYTMTEGNWENLSKSGDEMLRLYDLRLPLFPIDPKNVQFQIKYYKELFPGTDMAGIEFVAYVDMVTRSRATLGDAMIVDIKTSGVSLDTTPGILSLDQQLRTYAWVTGVSDVAFLWFQKCGRSLERGSYVNLLQSVADVPAGTAMVVAALDKSDEFAPGDLVWLVKNEAAIEAMNAAQGYKEGKLEQTKAAKERKLEWLKANAHRVPNDVFTKQRVQFVNAHIGLNEQLEAARQIGQDVAQIVYSNSENFWPLQGGVRYPNNKCLSCCMRGNCLTNTQLRDTLVSRSDEEWDVPANEDPE